MFNTHYICIQDITIGEGESIPPSTTFTKTWRIRNSGVENWPAGCSLRFTDGDQLSTYTQVNDLSLAVL